MCKSGTLGSIGRPFKGWILLSIVLGIRKGTFGGQCSKAKCWLVLHISFEL